MCREALFLCYNSTPLIFMAHCICTWRMQITELYAIIFNMNQRLIEFRDRRNIAIYHKAENRMLVNFL